MNVSQFRNMQWISSPSMHADIEEGKSACITASEQLLVRWCHHSQTNHHLCAISYHIFRHGLTGDQEALPWPLFLPLMNPISL